MQSISDFWKTHSCLRCVENSMKYAARQENHTRRLEIYISS